jgi:ceramide glucosyltransferase
LRPLKGLDTNLYENLESTFKQDYPKYELLLAVADDQDQALPVVRELLAKYPRTNARVIIGAWLLERALTPSTLMLFLATGEEVVGVNPKVNNLMRAYTEAAHDILWVIDSNISVAPGTLARAVDALVTPNAAKPRKQQIALVHHVPFAVTPDPAALGARVEQAFLNTNHAKMYIAINATAVDSCVVGKSNLYRRSDVARVDGTLRPIVPPATAQTGRQTGLAAFGRFLAEDNMIGLALWHELGLRHDLSCDVAHNAVGNMSLADYIWRRVRWIRVRKRMSMAATLVEPFTESIVLSVLTSLALRHLFGIPPPLFLILHYAWWIPLDLDVYASLAGQPLLASERARFLTAWAIRESLALPVWFLAMGGDTVEWRGRRYRVMQNGEVERASDTSLWTRWTARKRGGNQQYEPLLNDQ